MSVLYFEEAVNVCDCCGKSDLKGAYAVSMDDGISFFGSVCVLKNTGKTRKEVFKDIAKHKKDRVQLAVQEYNRSGVGDKFLMKSVQADEMGLKFLDRAYFVRGAFLEQQEVIEKITKDYGLTRTDLLGFI